MLSSIRVPPLARSGPVRRLFSLSEEQKGQSLVEWVRREGGYVHPAVVVNHSAGEEVRGVIASSAIQKDVVLCRLPRNLLLSADTAWHETTLGCGAALAKSGVDDDEAALAFLLAALIAEGSSPYAEALPSFPPPLPGLLSPPQREALPFWLQDDAEFSASRLERLASLIVAVSDAGNVPIGRNVISTLSSAAATPNEEDADAAEARNAALAALAFVHSRALRLTNADGARVQVLVPLIDSVRNVLPHTTEVSSYLLCFIQFNHAPTPLPVAIRELPTHLRSLAATEDDAPNAVLETDGTAILLVTSRNVNAAEPLTWSYGEKLTNEQGWLQYGFVPNKLLHSGATMLLRLPSRSYVHALRHPIRRPETENVAILRSRWLVMSGVLTSKEAQDATTDTETDWSENAQEDEHEAFVTFRVDAGLPPLSLLSTCAAMEVRTEAEATSFCAQIVTYVVAERARGTAASILRSAAREWEDEAVLCKNNQIAAVCRAAAATLESAAHACVGAPVQLSDMG